MRVIRGYGTGANYVCSRHNFSTNPGDWIGALYMGTNIEGDEDATIARVARTNSRIFGGISFDATRVVPYGPRTSPARYGVLPCVYLGA